MAAIYRRVFCPPAGVSQEQLARWQQALASAVSLQKQLEASSPYILQLLSDLEPSSEGFSVRHEPAEPFTVRVFDPAAPLSTPAELLRTTASLLDALRSFHDSRQERPPVHGGVCPGVLLVTADGIPKWADFGIAPAYAVLGEQVYKNLAAHPPEAGGGSAEERITGIWEVLKANITDRDDRLAGFIDPDKYESARYQAFEPASDILGAGVLLHLMAEHRHPYLYDDAEAHRNVDVLEFMLPLSVATRVRRADLMKSDDAAVRDWCELIAQMVDRSPEKRPPAGRAVEQVPRIKLDDIMRSRLESIAQGLERDEPVAWMDLRVTLRPMAENASSAADLRELAASMLSVCDAALMLDTRQWLDAEPLLGRVLSQPKVPGGALKQARALQVILERSRGVARELHDVRGVVDGLAGSPQEQHAQLSDAAHRIGRITPDGLLSPVREELTVLVEEVARRQSELATVLSELSAKSEAWVESARAARDSHDWDALQATIQTQPAFLTPEARTAAEQFRAALRAHEEELEAHRRLRQELERCLAEARELFGQGRLLDSQEKAARLKRPGTDPDLAQAAAELLAQVDQAAAQRAEQEAELLRRRALLDQTLQEATDSFEREDGSGLQEARRLCLSVLASEDAAPAQRESADLLLHQIRRRLDELEQAALSEIETLQRAESRLGESRNLLGAGQLLDARALVVELHESKFPHIRAQAAALLAELEAKLEGRRQELRELLQQADVLFASEGFEQAFAIANSVWEDRTSDEQLLARAHARMSEAEAELARLAQAKADAERDLNAGLAALGRADIVEARTAFDRARSLGRLSCEQRAHLDLVLVSMPSLETAWQMLEHEDYPAALETSLQVQADFSIELIREASGRLAEKARAGLAASLIRGIEKHLEHRAALEEQDTDLEEVSPDESLGHASPAWLRSRVGQFETFVQSCSVVERPAREPRLTAGTRLGGKYEIQEFLGRGGMGEVYRAVDLKLKREVALKISPPQASHAELAAALQNEAEAIASLSHPHIVHINSFDVIDGRPCFDTNYIRGKDLAAHAGEHPPTPMQAVTTLIPICEALAYAHGRGVLHRDIKPQNIYLGNQPGEGPWLIDFGLARIRSICDHRELEGLCGTPGYVAPEVIRSLGRDVDPRSDVFAMGCVLYVLLSGRAPFRSRSGKGRGLAGPSRTLLQTLRYQVDPIGTLSPDTPEPLRRICQKAMAADPAERFQTAQEMAGALHQFLQELQEDEARGELKTAQQRFEKRRRETPAELEDLDAAAVLADQAARRHIEPVQAQAKQLASEIGHIREEILDTIADARQQIEAAGAALTGREYRAALAGARAVIANPYVPELRASAQETAEIALAGVKAQRNRRLGIAGIGTVVVACIAGAIVLWPKLFAGSEKPEPKVEKPLVTQLPGGRDEQPVVSDPPRVEPKPPVVEPKPPVTEPKPPTKYAFLIKSPAAPVKEGHEAVLQTRWEEPAAAPEGVSYAWYRVEQGKRSPIAGQTTATFRKTAASPADAGEYVCVASLNGKPIAEKAISLQVARRVEYKIVLDVNGAIEVGADEERTITATLDPPAQATPTFEWFRLNAQDQPESFRRENPLRIKGADAGTFFCRFATADGQWESARLTIKTRSVAPPTEPKPAPPAPPAPAEVIAFMCEGSGEYIWPPNQIQCTVEFDKPAALQADGLKGVNCNLSAPLGTDLLKKHVFKLTPTGKDGDKVTVQLVEGSDKLVLGKNLKTRSFTYTIPAAPTVEPVAVDGSATRVDSNTFLATRLPVIIDLGAGGAADAVQVQGAQKTADQARLTLSNPTSDTIQVTIKAGSLNSPSRRPNAEKQFAVRIPLDAPKLESGLPAPAAVLKKVENLTLRFEKDVAVGKGALTVAGQEVPAVVTGNVVVFDTTKLAGLSGQVKATLDPAKITNAFQRPLKLPPDQTQWSYALPSAAYTAWMKPRLDLEASRLAGLRSGNLPQPAEILAAIGACKWGTPPAALAMDARTTRLREGLSERGRAIQPQIFAEYLWGEHVHVVCWSSQNPGQVDYANLGSSDGMLAELKSTTPTRGERLLGPVLARLKGAARLVDAKAPTLGVVLGLDGPLWFLHLENLPFKPVTFEPAIQLLKVKATDRGSQQVIVPWRAALSRLSDLCPETEDPDGFWYTSIWTMVSLSPAPSRAPDLIALCGPGLGETRPISSKSLAFPKATLLHVSSQSVSALVGVLGEEDAGFRGPRVLDEAAPIAIVADPVP